MKKLSGTGVALVTPFTTSGAIDFPALRRLLRHTARGVDYWVVMGTTGEASSLSKDEKKEVLQFILANNPARLPVVYGVGGNNTALVVEELKATDTAGVTALLSVSPYYNKPSQEGICRHFIAVADASPKPIILYNVPGRTGSNLTASTTLLLARHPNIIGIKEASGNLEQCMAIARDKPPGFLLISGDDLLTVPLYAIGAVGVISVLANAYPNTFRKMTTAAGEHDFTRAQKALFPLLDINTPMYEEGNPVGIKALLSELGICKPHVRMPLAQASPALQARIRSWARKNPIR
jgi:4-hydroxy-tetrahydrodipicolinate synthase